MQIATMLNVTMPKVMVPDTGYVHVFKQKEMFPYQQHNDTAHHKSLKVIIQADQVSML
jgi:hypothetical protein